MLFTLTINDESKSDLDEIKNPDSFDIKRAISIVERNEENFLILDSADPISNIEFIQAYVCDDGLFHLEVKNANGSYYSNDMQTKQDLLDILLNFVSGIVPDIRNWDYMGNFN